MAWCCQATSHCLNQCWPRSMASLGENELNRSRCHMWPENVFQSLSPMLGIFWLNVACFFCVWLRNVKINWSPRCGWSEYMGALYMEQYCVHCESGPSSNTEFPWGTMSADSFPGLLNSEQLVKLNSPGAQWEWAFPRGQSILNNMMSTSDAISGPSGDTEFPWSTTTIDFPGATQHQTMTSPLVMIFHSQLVILSSPGAQREWTRPRAIPHWRIWCKWLMIIHVPLVVLSPIWAQWEYTVSPGSLNIEQYYMIVEL